MGKLILLIFVINGTLLFGQTTDVDLNGKVFTGTATEVLLPEDDRMPVEYNEVISIINGRVFSGVLSIYSPKECGYTAKADHRRMTMFEIADFTFNTTGSDKGRKVDIEFLGIVAARSQLYGVLVIRYSDGNERKFTISALSK